MTERLAQEILEEVNRFILDTEELYNYFYDFYENGLPEYHDTDAFIEHFIDDILQSDKFDNFLFWDDEFMAVKGNNENERIYNAFELVINEFYDDISETIDYAYTELLAMQRENPYDI